MNMFSEPSVEQYDHDGEDEVNDVKKRKSESMVLKARWPSNIATNPDSQIISF